MNRTTLALIIAAMFVGLVGGLLLSGQQGVAFAQPRVPEAGGERPVDVAALITPSPVVAAVPFQSQTEYEQDPFEPTRLRRTTTQVRRVLLVRQDGVLEVKDAP